MSAMLDSAQRILAVLIKELIQMRRDRTTFAMMLGVPIMQLVLFGFAINLDPKHLPAAIYTEDNSPMVRRLVSAFEHSGYYEFVSVASSPQQGNELLERGEVSFFVYIPAGFTAQLVQGKRPQILVSADATDPAAASNAIGRLDGIIENALRTELKGPLAHLQATPSPVEVVVHAKYNPEAITQYNIVPGLLGVILTMTSVMITAMAMTREQERGNLENLLAMPVRPVEVMVGKITPYILVGIVQAVVILSAAHFLFSVPFFGSLALLAFGILLFVITNLSLGFTFSTVAKNQMQAMQMTFFFFLPSILLSGFMFPFRGMPHWAQTVGECLPLTHFLRVVRGIMLKGNGLEQLHGEFSVLGIFILVFGTMAMLRYKNTLD